MKVAYVFSTSGHTASYKLGKMILPQLESGTHGAEVAGQPRPGGAVAGLAARALDPLARGNPDIGGGQTAGGVGGAERIVVLRGGPERRVG